VYILIPEFSELNLLVDLTLVIVSKILVGLLNVSLVTVLSAEDFTGTETRSLRYLDIEIFRGIILAESSTGKFEG
jgi:hypothetical protein